MKDAKDQVRQFDMGGGVVRDAQAEAQRLLDSTVPGLDGMTREQQMWDRFLEHVDPRIQFEAFRLLKSYASGKPTEKKEIELNGNTYVAEIPPKMTDDEWRQRFAQPAKKKDGQA